MFVMITNGVVSARVSKGAFDNYYKTIGFWVEDGSESKEAPVATPIKDEESVETDEPIIEDEEEVVEDEDSDEAFIEEVMEKPISQWSAVELKRFAIIKNIDTSDAKKTSDARNIVKQYLQNQEKEKANA